MVTEAEQRRKNTAYGLCLSHLTDAGKKAVGDSLFFSPAKRECALCRERPKYTHEHPPGSGIRRFRFLLPNHHKIKARPDALDSKEIWFCSTTCHEVWFAQHLKVPEENQ